VIADEFTTLALQYEWRAVALTPADWRDQLAAAPIDLLFVESAWHGNGDAWRYQVIGKGGPSSHLRELVAQVRAAGIPTVFWNKEDPAHYGEAIDTARLFDWVFTTDSTLLDRYRAELGHDRVGVLPFAAQPTIHNPIRLLDDDARPAPLRDIAFAGMYFAHKYPERREQMTTLLGAAVDAGPKLEDGLDIFSRYLGADANYQFPAPYDAFVRGSLTYPEMLSAYRGYKVFLNVNSVVTSPSMFARRIFEITACGTPVVTMPSPATARFLPAGTLAVVADREEAYWTERAMVNNPELRARMTYLAQREIWLKHTYTARVDQVLTAVGLGERCYRRPTITPLISTIRPERLDGVLDTLARQREVDQRPIILTHGFEAPDAARARARELGLEVDWVTGDAANTLGANYNLMLERVDADFIAKLDDDDLYGDYHLFESLAAADYARAEVVGKHAYFVHLEAESAVVLRFPEWEHRYTSFLAGPTLVAATDLARQVHFPDTTTGEDTGFLQKASAAGARLYAASRFGFVQRRAAGGHTWGISSAEVLATGRISHWGAPGDAEIPGEAR
ncbi:glycosyltransferase, partial [Actinomyces sp. MRS3W]|uniref:CgeB family protein n=1 Tax=Actinomyces sp. MRS3W TaxID=2800796 RepID=UPI0028FD3D83